MDDEWTHGSIKSVKMRHELMKLQINMDDAWTHGSIINVDDALTNGSIKSIWIMHHHTELMEASNQCC